MRLRAIRVPALCACVFLASCDGPTAPIPDLWQDGSWHPLGAGVDGGLYTVTEYGGDVVVGGGFHLAGTFPAGHVARWDGSEWHPIGGGVSNVVLALVPFQEELIAMGHFTEAGGTPAPHLARWDGSEWRSMDGTLPCCNASLVVRGEHLFMPGLFETEGGDEIPRLGRWDGSSWNPVAVEIDGESHAAAGPLAVHDGDLLVWVTSAGQLARWNGVAWSWMDTPPGRAAHLASGDGELYLVGSAETGWSSIWRWAGSEWQSLGNLQREFFGAALVHEGSLVVGGRFVGDHEGTVLRLSDDGWEAIDGGMDGDVRALAGRGRSLLAAGAFTTVAGQPAGGIAEFRVD